jgi:hypothetical protein
MKISNMTNGSIFYHYIDAHLSQTELKAVRADSGLDPNRPLLVQISRFDRKLSHLEGHTKTGRLKRCISVTAKKEYAWKFPFYS